MLLATSVLISNSIPGSTGVHVASASAAHENQALQCDYSSRGTWKKIIQSQRFFENKIFSSFMPPLKTYLTSQETGLKVENVIGPFAKKNIRIFCFQKTL